MRYSWGSILMSMANLSIYTFIHLNLIVSFKQAHKYAYIPQTVIAALKVLYHRRGCRYYCSELLKSQSFFKTLT